MRNVLATRRVVVGKLPTTTGWQPVLPRDLRFAMRQRRLAFG
jgi:hypothetical protein